MPLQICALQSDPVPPLPSLATVGTCCGHSRRVGWAMPSLGCGVRNWGVDGAGEELLQLCGEGGNFWVCARGEEERGYFKFNTHQGIVLFKYRE